jgi:hypothetical protein
MTDPYARPYIVQAINLIRPNVSLLIAPSLTIGASYLSFLFPAAYAGILAEGSVLATLIVYPLMYGRFAEIITGQVPVSWWQLLRQHWLNFILVSLALHLPLFLWLLISYSSSLASGNVTDLVYGLISVLGLYVIPLVFLTGQRFSCIPLGIKCLIGNFQFSLPLVFLSMLSIALGSFMGHTGAESPMPPFSAFAGLILIFLTVGVDFVVFVAASLVLKEKLFQGGT